MKFIFVLILHTILYSIPFDVDTVWEGIGVQTVTIDTRSSLWGTYYTQAQTAIGGPDYISTSKFIIPWRSRHYDINIEIVDDNIYEQVEYFYIILGPDTTKIYIIDDDLNTHPPMMVSDTLFVPENGILYWSPIIN